VKHRIPIPACTILLLLFASTAWFAINTKSPVYDEPYHALSSWLQLRYDDFRFDNEDQPLWQYWAALPNGRSSLTANFDDPDWKTMPKELVHQWYFGMETLYRTPGNDPVQFIARCRLMMLSLAILLGVLICYWSWKIAGPIAAVISAVFFCLDPNFLAHSSLMKNDVVFAMSMFGLAMALCRAGKKLDIEAIGWVALMSVVTLTTKFSGFAAILLVPLLLGVRAMLPQAWPVLGRTISSRFKRLMIAGTLTIFVAGISYLGIWAVYGFRFAPTPEKDTWLNLTEVCDKIRTNHMVASYDGSPPPGAMPDAQLPIPAKVMMFASGHHLLPQAFIAGFLFTYANALIRCDYLCGQISMVGWWWYFPFVMLVKTPIATLIAMMITAWIAIRRIKRGRLRDVDRQWTALCIAIPVLIFLASAMSSSVNIGIRHILAIYPFIFVATGCTLASMWKSQKTKSRYAIIGLGILLGIESLSVYPDFIPYFNVIAANTSGGKISLLGDSNLDWGQDLPLLVQWQHEHPDKNLYLSYFGYADPVFYGIKYIPLHGGYAYDTDKKWPDQYSPSILAISASNLQGLLMDPRAAPFYEHWRTQKPIAVLGDSIYLFEYPERSSGS
jgi:hypothetical protein